MRSPFSLKYRGEPYSPAPVLVLPMTGTVQSRIMVGA
jgi:hypothetical protein